MRIKGMVLVAGKTYRITRVSRGRYDVTRILDDVLVGTFEVGPPLVVLKANDVDESLVRDIGRAAVQSAKTSWMGRVSTS